VATLRAVTDPYVTARIEQAHQAAMIRAEKPFTAAYDGQMALDADELEYQRGYGPYMDASRAGQMFLIR